MHAPRVVERLKAEHWLYSGFDSPVILFHDVVQVFAANES
jgi:hypothetical protein